MNKIYTSKITQKVVSNSAQIYENKAILVFQFFENQKTTV